MDKLCKYVDKELEDIESKVDRSGKLSGAEIEYADKLAHLKKSLLTNEAMEDSGYSGRYDYEGRGYRGSSYRGSSYARGRKRDSMGRYSSEDGYSHAEAKEDFMNEVYDLMDHAPDEHTRKKVERFINEMK